MKRLLLTTAIVLVTGLVHAEDNQSGQTQTDDSIFATPVQIERLSVDEMQKTKAGVGSAHFGVGRGVSSN